MIAGIKDGLAVATLHCQSRSFGLSTACTADFRIPLSILNAVAYLHVNGSGGHRRSIQWTIGKQACDCSRNVNLNVGLYMNY